MENLGSLAILLAFCLALYAVAGSVVGRLKRKPFLVVSAERAVYAVWALITLALLTFGLYQAFEVAPTEQTMGDIQRIECQSAGFGALVVAADAVPIEHCAGRRLERRRLWSGAAAHD